MASCIPFISSLTDCRLVSKDYSDSDVLRLNLESGAQLIDRIPKKSEIWLDPLVDGFHRGSGASPKWRKYISQFPGYERFDDPQFLGKPDKTVVSKFVTSVLDACLVLQPKWISVPQLPLVNDANRNRVNRCMAEAAGTWRSKSGFPGRLVLPVIGTDQRQMNGKTERNQKVSLIRNCAAQAAADGIWTVESSLCDQDGSSTFERKRFPGVIAMQQELRAAIGGDLTYIAGPYWGLNLVLWARGLATIPAIGVGNAYQYHIPGGPLQQGKVRVALGPLRRLAVVSSHLEKWLGSVVQALPAGDLDRSKFAELRQQFPKLSVGEIARSQVSHFYKQWLKSIEAVPAQGRGLAMYQDLSSAYVLGKNLVDLPKEEGTARRPERVAQQLMLSCL